MTGLAVAGNLTQKLCELQNILILSAVLRVGCECRYLCGLVSLLVLVCEQRTQERRQT